MFSTLLHTEKIFAVLKIPHSELFLIDIVTVNVSDNGWLCTNELKTLSESKRLMREKKNGFKSVADK